MNVKETMEMLKGYNPELPVLVTHGNMLESVSLEAPAVYTCCGSSALVLGGEHMNEGTELEFCVDEVPVYREGE